MADEPKMVPFILTSNRYWDGKYIAATVEAPVEVMLPETTKEDNFLKRAKGKTAAESAVKLAPHFAVKSPIQGMPTERVVESGHQEKEPTPAETREAGKKKDRSL